MFFGDSQCMLNSHLSMFVVDSQRQLNSDLSMFVGDSHIHLNSELSMFVGDSQSQLNSDQKIQCSCLETIQFGNRTATLIPPDVEPYKPWPCFHDDQKWSK